MIESLFFSRGDFRLLSLIIILAEYMTAYTLSIGSKVTSFLIVTLINDKDPSLFYYSNFNLSIFNSP